MTCKECGFACIQALCSWKTAFWSESTIGRTAESHFASARLLVQINLSVVFAPARRRPFSPHMVVSLTSVRDTLCFVGLQRIYCYSFSLSRSPIGRTAESHFAAAKLLVQITFSVVFAPARRRKTCHWQVFSPWSG